MKIKRLLNYYKKEILACSGILALTALLCFLTAFTVRGCSESFSDGTVRQGIVDIGKGVKSIIEDINKDEN